MRVLFLGDVIGRPGRTAVKLLVPSLVHDHGIDLTISTQEDAKGKLNPLCQSLPRFVSLKMCTSMRQTEAESSRGLLRVARH
ncbi:YmdB family metallophosphoesterase [Candidatus Hakubella thermalkaliphila]|uniref:YmdB family metallophosphoesterase n=1 Tax=Candidatus Hakubella thermalkaliphila TaxID=2754717 RepID=UPI0015939E6D|nr:YmdB family metallophosphoesterase [Candidatus Hakubella thermalkaliphila]